MKRIALAAAAVAVAALLFFRPGHGVGPDEAPRPGWSHDGSAAEGASAAESAADSTSRHAWGSAAGPPASRAPRRAAAARDGGTSLADGRAAREAELVYVAGDVARPGVYALAPDARARDAISLAGGAKADADLVAVNLAAHVADGDEIVVPKLGEAPAAAPRGRRSRSRIATWPRSADAADARVDADADPGVGGSKTARSGKRRGAKRHRGAVTGGIRTIEAGGALPPAGRVDINAADAATLATIPGIGPGLAERIVAFRQANGPFAAVDELLDVSGITDRRLDAILPYVVAR